MNRIGEMNANSKGQKFIISDYKSSQEVNVLFENNKGKTITYPQFKSGHVSMPGDDNADNWVGEVVEDRNGEECTIVEYNSANDITVQYEDGDIVANLSEEDIISDAFDRDRNNAGFLASTDFYDRGNIELERKMTYDNVVYMLNRFKRCVMIRPCSFGKTKIGLKLFSSPRYKRCLFLHPQNDDANATIIQNSHSQKHIDTQTYAWLRSRSEKKLRSLQYDIVFCDEIHGVAGTDDGEGASKTYEALKILMESHPNTHFVGATATPARMDGLFPVVSAMFHNHTCYPYTDEDAFEDGLLKPPYYYYCIRDVEKIQRKEVEKIVHVEMDREDLEKTLKLTENEIREIDTKYMDQHIKEVCSSVLESTKYMRFIVFYPTNEEIRANKEQVISWFQKAYPNHEVCSLIVTDRSRKSLRDVDNLPTEASDPQYEGRIDLIFNCEKLCMGYHSEYITGLVIDRKTKSLTKYQQMMGRLLSCDNDNPVIIFDIANNIHAEFVCKIPKELVQPVVPQFNTKPMTFQELLQAYPRARHWNEIKKNNRKAKKSEELIVAHAIASGEITASDMTLFDVAPAAAYAKYAGTTAQNIDKAEKLAQQENISFEDACDRITGVTHTPHKQSADIMMHDGLLKARPTTSRQSSEDTFSPGRVISSGSLSQIESASDETPEEEYLGYLSSHIYDPISTDLYSRRVKLINKQANFEEEFRKLIDSINKQTYEKILSGWRSYKGLENYTYSSYNDVHKDTFEYKALKSWSEFLFGVPIEKTLAYLIEGRIA